MLEKTISLGKKIYLYELKILRILDLRLIQQSLT